MPTYDYQCAACGAKSEVFQSMTAKPLVKCTACGERKLKRLIGAGAGFIFKGSGFYQTDYRSDSYKEGAKQEVSAGSASDATPSAAAGAAAGESGAKSADTGPSKTSSKAAASESAAPAPKAASTKPPSGGSKGSGKTSGRSGEL